MSLPLPPRPRPQPGAPTAALTPLPPSAAAPATGSTIHIGTLDIKEDWPAMWAAETVTAEPEVPYAAVPAATGPVGNAMTTICIRDAFRDAVRGVL